MDEFEDRKPYTLQELFKKLEDIRCDNSNKINIAKALYTIVLELNTINNWIESHCDNHE